MTATKQKKKKMFIYISPRTCFSPSFLIYWTFCSWFCFDSKRSTFIQLDPINPRVRSIYFYRLLSPGHLILYGAL